MELANYTSENIARGLGLEGFANDLQLAEADQAIRVLLLPSFHPELCISFMQKEGEHKLSIVAAREQIWQQVWPMPKPAVTFRAEEPITEGLFQSLASALREATESAPLAVVVLDGMRAHAVLRGEHQCQLNLNENVAERPQYSAFVALALTEAWQAVQEPLVRNALRSAAEYVGVTLPEEPTPAEKPLVRTVILGPESVTSSVLKGLKRHHES